MGIDAIWPGALVAALLFLVAAGYANVGLGGGLLYFPILSFFYPRWGPATVVAMTLLFSMATLASSWWAHRRARHVRAGLALAVAVPMAAAAFVGARFTAGAAAPFVKGAFACVLLAISVKMALDLRAGRGPREASGRPASARSLAVLAAAGAIAGLLSGSVGIGGGVVMVPVFVYAVGLATREAVGTASLALLVTAATGLATYLGVHRVELPRGPAVFFLAAALAGGSVGSRLGLRALRARHVRAAFVAALAVAAVLTGAEAVLR